MIDNKLFVLCDYRMINNNVGLFDFGDHRELHSRVANKALRLEHDDSIELFGNGGLFLIKGKPSGESKYFLTDDYFRLRAEHPYRPQKITPHIFSFDAIYDAEFNRLPWTSKDSIIEICYPFGSNFIALKEKGSGHKLKVLDYRGNRYKAELLSVVNCPNARDELVDVDGTRMVVIHCMETDSNTKINSSYIVYTGTTRLTPEGRNKLRTVCEHKFKWAQFVDIWLSSDTRKMIEQLQNRN